MLFHRKESVGQADLVQRDTAKQAGAEHSGSCRCWQHRRSGDSGGQAHASRRHVDGRAKGKGKGRTQREGEERRNTFKALLIPSTGAAMAQMGQASVDEWTELPYLTSV
jgi:hypothetical protein